MPASGGRARRRVGVTRDDILVGPREAKNKTVLPQFFFMVESRGDRLMLFPTWRPAGEGGLREGDRLIELEPGDCGKLDWALKGSEKKTAAKIQNAQSEIAQGTDDSGFVP